MNAATIATMALATAAVVTLAGGVLALAYRTGRLVGRVESLIESGNEHYARLDGDIRGLAANLSAHITQHRWGRWGR